jgi:sec-independent protein translocase protein TatA
MNPLLFISGSEIFIILLVVLVLFGAKKIPELAKGLGKGMREFKKATDDIKKEINDSSDDIVKDISDMKDNIEKKL